MSDSKSQVFSGVAPAQFAKLVQKANAAGMDISGNSGRARKMGIEVSWEYSEPEQKLVLTCLHAPFFMSVNDVNLRLRDMVSEALA